MKSLLQLLAQTTLCLGILFAPALSEAAVTVSSPALLVSPSAPGPTESVTITFTNANNLPNGTSLQWFVDDVEQTNNHNLPKLTFTTKEVGDTSTVAAHLTTPAGGTTIHTVTITPERLDVIINADTHTPSFYLGRSLPSRSSTITARALLFSDIAGPYRYEWTINGRPHTGAIGNSNDAIQFTTGLNFETALEVRVFTSSGEAIAQKAMTIPVVTPEILFYESNPLKGLMLNTIKTPYYFLQPEVTFRGEPYYVAGTVDDLKIEWEVDNRRIESDANPFELTLVKTQESGEAQVGLSIINTKDYLEAAKASFKLNY